MINGGIAQESIKLTTDKNTHSIKLAGDLGITGADAPQVVTIDLDASKQLNSLDLSGLTGDFKYGGDGKIDLSNVIGTDNTISIEINGNDKAEAIEFKGATATITSITLKGDLGYVVLFTLTLTPSLSYVFL